MCTYGYWFETAMLFLVAARGSLQSKGSFASQEVSQSVGWEGYLSMENGGAGMQEGETCFTQGGEEEIKYDSQ